MRSIAFISLFSFATLVAAQQPQQPPDIDKQTEERLRAERAAGGVREITPEEKASANAGAGPHRTFKERKGGKSSKSVDDKGTPLGEGVGAGAGATRRR